MSEQGKELRIEGYVRVRSYDRGAEGKQFLGAVLECADGGAWVIDYDEQSPFHAFAERRVLVTGEPYQPKGQYLMGWRGNRSGEKFGHLRFSTMRLVEVRPDAELVEVGASHELSGRFERGAGEALSFITDRGDRFLVFNDPAGANIGQSVEVSAYPVRPSIPVSTEAYLWVICPCSMGELWAWRERHADRQGRAADSLQE